MIVAGLLQIDLPAQTLRYADGGFTKWGSDTFDVENADFGTLYSVEVDPEGLNNLAPGGRVTFSLPDASAADDVADPAFQGSRVQLWLAYIDETTGLVTTADLMGDYMIDVPRIVLSSGARFLVFDLVSQAERLFMRNRGNVCSSAFHKKVWPGELGFDNADGVPLQEAWGVAGPTGGTSASYRTGGAGFAIPV